MSTISHRLRHNVAKELMDRGFREDGRSIGKYGILKGICMV